jgi:cytochrome c6
MTTDRAGQPGWRVGLTVLLVLMALNACSPGTQEQELIAAGEELYTNSCARCHQADGKGFAPIYPHLAGNPLVTLHDPDPVIQIVLEGSGGMRGFRTTMEQEELAQVISYIRNAWGNEAPVVTPTRVK